MVYFHGVDVMSHQITVTFDYSQEQKEEVLKFVRSKFGEQVTLNELSTFIPELQESLD